MTGSDAMQHLLPKGVHDIAAVIGLPAALQIVKCLGGLELYIPKSRNSRVWTTLAELVGDQAADRLVAAFGDTRLTIPRGVAVLRAVRNARLRAAYDAGAAICDLALEFRLTTRHVREILNMPDECPAEQLGLF